MPDEPKSGSQNPDDSAEAPPVQADPEGYGMQFRGSQGGKIEDKIARILIGEQAEAASESQDS